MSTTAISPTRETAPARLDAADWCARERAHAQRAHAQRAHAQSADRQRGFAERPNALRARILAVAFDGTIAA